MTIRELLKVARDSSTVPNIPTAPSISSLESDIRGYIQQANLLPEQVRAVSQAAASSSLIPNQLAAGALEVQLAKLNLNQILDLGYKIQSRSQSVKLKDMVMTANNEDARYYDVTFKLIALAVPEAPVAEPEDLGKRRGR